MSDGLSHPTKRTNSLAVLRQAVFFVGLSDGLSCLSVASRFLSSSLVANVVSPTFELLLGQTIGAIQFIAKRLPGTSYLYLDLQPTIFFIHEPDFDGRPDFQRIRQVPNGTTPNERTFIRLNRLPLNNLNQYRFLVGLVHLEDLACHDRKRRVARYDGYHLGNARFDVRRHHPQ